MFSAMPDHRTPAPTLDLVGGAEAQKMLGGIHRTTLTRWVADGRIPLAYKIPGSNGAMLFQRQDVIDLKTRLDAAVIEVTDEQVPA